MEEQITSLYSAKPCRTINDSDVVILTCAELEKALREAAEAHHVFEDRTGQHDENWPHWYARHIVGHAHSKC